jgi:hypothetical protein
MAKGTDQKKALKKAPTKSKKDKKAAKQANKASA